MVLSQMCSEVGEEGGWNWKKIKQIFDRLKQLSFEDEQERTALYQELDKLRQESKKINRKRDVFWSEMENLDIIYFHLKWQEQDKKDLGESPRQSL